MIMTVVIMMVILLSVVMIGLIGRNYSFVLSAEEELRHKDAEQVARAAFWKAYQVFSSGGTIDSGTTSTMSVNGRTYTYTYIITPEGELNKISINVAY